MTARRSCVAVRVRKKEFVGGIVNHFPGFVIRTVRGPIKIPTKQVWVRVGNTNNSTVPESF